MLCDVENVNGTTEQRLTRYSGNYKQNISQRKSRFYTQVMVLLKPSLLHLHLTGDAMII